MRIIDEMFCQLEQLPFTRMPLQGVVLIAQALRKVNVDQTAFGCQVAGHFGIDFAFDIKDDRTPVPIDNLAELGAGFAAAGGAEFDDVTKLSSFRRWLHAVHLSILPFSDVQVLS